MAFQLPSRGLVFWPVGTGDSTTVCIDEKTVVQIDLHHLEKADDKEEPHWAIIDELVKVLPKRNGKPYLSVFALTHPDQDHIRGFKELKDKVEIDELWHTPRIFREYEASHELCEDAKVFRKEAQRRRESSIKAQGDPGAGHRVRVFGHTELYDEDKYKNFPKEFREYPGTSTTKVNAKDYTGTFEAFIHAPFKDVGEQERNDTSLALQVKLSKGDDAELAALLLGDVSYLAEDRLTVAEQMDRPIAEAGKKGIFSTEEGQSLLDTGWGYAMPGAISMAVIMFGSTRSEENSKQDPDAPMERRICWEDLDEVEKLIGIRPEVAKTRVARDAGFPPNLRKMLHPLRGTGPLYTGKRLDLAFAAIARKAGVPWKFNGLRHSCITYDMLLAPNATEVANRSGNSVQVIERCYRNIKAKRKDAVGWFKLRPRVAWGAYLRPDQAKPMQA